MTKPDWLPETPPPVSGDPRWNNEAIPSWRALGAQCLDEAGYDVFASQTEELRKTLREYGFQTITEDLLYVLWVETIMAYVFTTGIGQECHAFPHVVSHVTAGLRMKALALLGLEAHVGEPV